MRITVTHLTKMGPGFVCVAGIEQGTGRHIRPIANRQLRLEHIECTGGVFSLGSIIDLGQVRNVGVPPENEDRRFLEHRSTCVGKVGAEAFYSLLQSFSQRRLQRIFGPDLEASGTTCSLPRGKGQASLGVLRIARVDDLIVERRESVRGPYETLRMVLTIGRHQFRFPVTDLRFARLARDGQSWEIASDAVDDVRTRLTKSSDILLSVGLSRPFQRSAGDEARHWVQVNNVHLSDDPLWAGTLSEQWNPTSDVPWNT